MGPYKISNDNIINYSKLIDLKIIYRSLEEMNYFHEKNEIFIEENETLGVNVYYKYNNMGYRSEDFDKPKELLVLGCSQTEGQGMIDEFTWPNILSKTLGIKFDRLAMRGDSIQGQVSKAFEYFRLVGNPKLIVGTFPLYRLEIPIVDKIYNFSKNINYYNRDKARSKGVLPITLNKISEDMSKYLKRPFDPREVITRESAMHISFTFISMLEQYCETNNIGIVWNIWEDEDQGLYKYIKYNDKISHVLKNYNSYYEGPENPFNKDPGFKLNMECHSEYSSHPLFNKASDYSQESIGHWSIHKHLHVAESFYKEIKRRSLI